MLFARLWQELGIGKVLDGRLAARAFSFAVERAVFVATVHRLFVSGSDRDCASWMADYDIGGAQALLPRDGVARQDRRGGLRSFPAARSRNCAAAQSFLEGWNYSIYF